MYHTQVVDTFNDQVAHKPLQHETESAARAYAVMITDRRRCDCRVLAQGQVIDVYSGGLAIWQTEVTTKEKQSWQ